MSVLSQESVSGLVSAGHQGVWGGDEPAYLLAPLTSTAGGPGAVGPAEVGSISLAKTKVCSFLFEHCASPPSAEGVYLKPEIAVP